MPNSRKTTTLGPSGLEVATTVRTMHVLTAHLNGAEQGQGHKRGNMTPEMEFVHQMGGYGSKKGKLQC